MIPAILFGLLLIASRFVGGVMVDTPPLQVDISPKLIANVDNHPITAVATYDINARVLHVKHYDDEISDVAPLDLALGWQEMSSNQLLRQLWITQVDRFYYWQSYKKDFPKKTIETQSANNHLIPMNSFVKEQLMSIKQNDIIELKGYLVNVYEPKYQDVWKTSLTREDTGDGACEIVYVESVDIKTIHHDEKP